MNGWQPPNFLTFVKYLKYIGEIGTVYSKNWGNLLSSLKKLGKFIQFALEDGKICSAYLETGEVSEYISQKKLGDCATSA